MTGFLGRSAALLVLAATASCGDSRLVLIFAHDASFGDLPLPLVDMSAPETPMDMPGQPPDADGSVITDSSVMDVLVDVVPEVPTVTNCPSMLVGYGSGTRGGLGGQIRTATTAAELKLLAEMDVPMVIQIATTITLTEQIRPRSNKTIEGVAQGAGLFGGGLYIIGADNVIVRGLTIAKALNADAIGIDNSRHVWIDHCDLSSDRLAPENAETYDGLLDITHASDYVTVSWNKFHDHHRATIVGHSSSPTAEAEDTGHLIVTYHHNWFTQVTSNTPRVRFGRVHVFNNLYEDIEGSLIISQMDATVLIEGNAFRNVGVPIRTYYQPSDRQGFVSVLPNNFCIASCGSDDIQMVKAWVSPDYPYTPDSAASVSAVVMACAGARF